MSKLFDRLLVEGAVDPATRRRDLPEPIRAYGSQMQVFDIQNVADYYHQFVHTADRAWSLQDIPNLAPPFPFFWMEFTLRGDYYPDAPPDARSPRVGIEFIAPRLHDPEVTKYIAPERQAEIDHMYRRLYQGEHIEFAPGIISPTFPDDPAARAHEIWAFMMGFRSEYPMTLNERGRLAIELRNYAPVEWCVGARAYLEEAKGQIYPLMTAMVFVEPDGSLYPFDEAGSILLFPDFWQDPTTELAKKGMQDALDNIIMPAFLAVSFLHCKNVQHLTNDAPPKVAKNYKKKHGREPVRFHVLEIEPMKKTLRTQGQIEQTGLKKALHICRGHFKTYTAERPLFGRVTGTYFWGDHLRGSVEEGVVDKDYQVNDPAQE